METIIDTLLKDIRLYNILKGIFAMMALWYIYVIGDRYVGNKKTIFRLNLIGCMVFIIIMTILEYKTRSLETEIRDQLDIDCSQEIIKEGE